MPTYRYRAVEAGGGRSARGSIEAADAEAAVAGLRARGLLPTGLRAVPERRWWMRRSRRVGHRSLAAFTRQFATLAAAGMPLERGLELLAGQEGDPAWRAVIADLAEVIRAGGRFSDGLARHPRAFDGFYLGMARAGESSGKLDAVMERLADHLEKRGCLRARVRAAMTYPAAVMAAASAIVGVLMTFVVPRFEGIFSGLLKGAPLPGLTRAVLGASRFGQDHWLAGAGVVLAAAAAGRLLLRSRAGARLRDRWLLRLPGIGALLRKAAVARFSRTLGTLLSSAVPILSALQLTRDTSGNTVIADAIDLVHRRVKAGDSVARPLAESGVFPPMVAGMVLVGEETGALPEMLVRIADVYDNEVDAAVAGLTSLIEPVMIVLMALVVGTLVLALFLPILRVIQLMA